MNKKDYGLLLDELCNEYCNKDYCILKQFLISARPDPRLLMQLKCVEKFRYEQGSNQSKELDWTEGFTIWVQDGYAKRFNILYDENKKFKDLYTEIMKI